MGEKVKKRNTKGVKDPSTPWETDENTLKGNRKNVVEES